MKKNFILFICFFFLIPAGWSQPVWQQVSSPVNENLVSVCFVDFQHGWILSEQGTLISTTNGGQSWTTLSLGSGTFTCVHFTDQVNGWITGYQGSSFIMFTLDGGANWQLSGHPEAERLNDVYFHDPDHGWVVGIKDNLNYCLYTGDAGTTWTPQMNIHVQEAELFSVNFRDGQNGNACGKAGTFFSTSNAGALWGIDISIPSYGQDLFSVYNWGTNKGCTVGTSGIALNTVNGWSTYIESNTNTEQTLHAVSADPATNSIWAAGENGTIIYTSNYVLGWMIQPTGTTEGLKGIDMMDASTGWAVGNNGTILRYGSNTGTDELKIQSSEFKVEVYPNPAGKVASFRFQACQGSSPGGQKIPGCPHVTMKLYDVQGSEVATILDEKLPAGEHEVQYDMLDLPDGFYMVRMTAGEWSATGKIIVMH